MAVGAGGTEGFEPDEFRAIRCLLGAMARRATYRFMSAIEREARFVVVEGCNREGLRIMAGIAGFSLELACVRIVVKMARGAF